MERLLPWLAALALFAPQHAPLAGSTERPPNVVLLAWRDLTEANLAASPTLSRIAASGTVVSGAHVSTSRGRPARAAFLTGRLAHQTGIRLDERRSDLAPSTTLSFLLHEAGYATFAAGRFPADPTESAVDASGDDVDPETRAGREELGRRLGALPDETPFFLWWAPERDAESDELDAALGSLLDTLDELGELERTLVVAVGDRRALRRFDLGLTRERALRTPLVVAYPGVVPAGRELETAATTLDAVPTVLDFVGLEPADELSGTSLRARLSTASDPTPETIHGALFHRPEGETRRALRRDPNLNELGALYARDGRWKYVLALMDIADARGNGQVAYRVSAGQEQLFDLEADPQENEDRSGDPALLERLAALRSGTLAWWERTGGPELPLPPLFTGLPPPRAGGRAADARPNIVLLISDDHDARQLGFMGHPAVETPTVDTLAEAGIVFETAHVTMSRCRPSLATLLSGLYPHQNGILDNQSPRELDPQGSLPSLLKQAGYATFVGGKFWEGNHHAMGFTDPTWLRSNDFVRDDQDDLFAFLEEHCPRRPVFVWWAPLLPHGPFNPPRRFRARVADAAVDVPDSFEGDRGKYEASERLLYAMTAWFDEGLTELRDELNALGQLENTLFCFLIDNGWSNAFPSKGSVFEQGIRTPMFFTWSAGLEGGRRSDALVSSVDVYPTLLDFAGVEIPSSAAGRSLRAELEGEESPPRELVCGASYLPRSGRGPSRPEDEIYALYARTPRWKYVLYLRAVRPRNSKIYAAEDAFPARDAGDEDLFDLATDPDELDDRSEAPELLEIKARLKAEALEWWRTTGGAELELP